MPELYDDLKPVDIEKNPVEAEILKILTRYVNITKDIDRQAAQIQNAKNKKDLLKKLELIRARMNEDILKLKKSAQNWAKISSAKSYLSGESLLMALLEIKENILMIMVKW